MQLEDYSINSPLMRISLVIDGEKYKFNLGRELKITPNNYTEDILRQPRLYGFLGMVHAQLVAKLEAAESLKKQTWAQLYSKYKSEPGLGGRPCSDDLAKAKAEKSGKYQLIVRSYITAKKEEKLIANALKAFEQRMHLLQTLSSNQRKTS